MFSPRSWLRRLSAWYLSRCSGAAREVLAYRPSTSNRLVELLARDSLPEVRLAVARRDHLPHDLCMPLVHDDDLLVRMALASQPLDTSCRAVLLRDLELRVVNAMLRCPTITYQERLDAILSSPRMLLSSPQVVRQVLVDSQRKDLMLFAACRRCPELTEHVVSHPDCSKETVERLIRLQDRTIAFSIMAACAHDVEAMALISWVFCDELFDDTDPEASAIQCLFRGRFVQAPSVPDAMVARMQACLVLEAAPHRLSESDDPEVLAAIAALAAENPRSLAEVRESAALLLAS